MKKRVFSGMDDAVFRVVICTEDWSVGDLELMVQFGEPEINVGGEVVYIVDGERKAKVLGDEFVRVVHGFPYARIFDVRDYDSVKDATAIGAAWKEMVLERIDAAVSELRSNVSPLPTEEVYEI